MANTYSPTVPTNRAFRDKYKMNRLNFNLRSMLVAEAICSKDTSDSMRIQSPYGSTPTAVVTTLTGDYTPATYTVTDDTLTVTEELKVAEQVYDFERVISSLNFLDSRIDEQSYVISQKIDQYVVNVLATDALAGNDYTTPVGGFTVAANINTIFATLLSRVAGYAEAYDSNYFVVLENTDTAGLYAAGVMNGYKAADDAIKNGIIGRWMGTDIYVVRTGTFVSATIGTRTFANSGHRVFGCKNVATYAMPGGFRFEEKGVSGKTGMEVVTYAYLGAKVWAPKAGLFVDIILA